MIKKSHIVNLAFKKFKKFNNFGRKTIFGSKTMSVGKNRPQDLTRSTLSSNTTDK